MQTGNPNHLRFARIFVIQHLKLQKNLTSSDANPSSHSVFTNPKTYSKIYSWEEISENIHIGKLECCYPNVCRTVGKPHTFQQNHCSSNHYSECRSRTAYNGHLTQPWAQAKRIESKLTPFHHPTLVTEKSSAPTTFLLTEICATE